VNDICITCCWQDFVHYAWVLAKLAFWPLVVYAVVYATGAVAFLANLRAKVGPYGRLEVAHDSWAYMLARPKRYTDIQKMIETCGSLARAKEHYSYLFEPTSICAVYARLLNMLLFVWPFVTLYLIVLSMGGTVLFGVILGIGYVKPKMSSNGWLELVKLREPDNWPNSPKVLLYVPITYYVAAFLLVTAVLNFGMLLRGAWLALIVTLCLLPLIALVLAVVYGSRKVMRERDDADTSVGLAAEFLESKKERFCKVVEIK
jgi:hypothetical protein